MNRLLLILSGFFFLALLSCGRVDRHGNSPDAKPNIVIILADDLGYGSVGVYGANQNVVLTPSIDGLAEEGRLFTNAYTPSSVCSPTRYGLLTGRYDWRTGKEYGVLGSRSSLHIRTDRPTLASMLKNAIINKISVIKMMLASERGQVVISLLQNLFRRIMFLLIKKMAQPNITENAKNSKIKIKT